ncbi:hypothetical protein FEM03_18015 [Phragmitibacter flavus]|uniref:Nucleotide-diphospho-sugar transferase domain-containing protein n=1 Tax=Phragmitibacter flavus TaxID=2576071 RepID=A0A5R8KAD2_9BACT|nr:putative nucleotide-diphospho-sugar transferase [Phragmitibacter flavus]TLD69268.1 hypothetical protein FEM03_18015 [Phragmitibacter flavus]
MKRGIIYVATGSKHLSEALKSAASVRSVMPSIPMSIWTDQNLDSSHLFDQVFPAPSDELGRVAKMRAMANSPYEETLFLDSDTFMCSSCEDIFWPLKKYDIAISHEVYRNEYAFEEFPEAFPALNTGVVVYNNNEKTRAFFREWESNYMTTFRHKRKVDQPAFRYTLFHSDLMHYILPHEYNFRTNYPVVLGGFAVAKIIHDRSRNVEELGKLFGHDTGHPPVYFGPVTIKYFGAWIFHRLKTVAVRMNDLGYEGIWDAIIRRLRRLT